MYTPYVCRYRDNDRRCYNGCVPGWTVCHKWARGACSYGAVYSCRHGYHSSRPPRSAAPAEPTPQPAPQPTPEQRAAKLLGLDPQCAFLSEALVQSCYRQRCGQEHPDKLGSNPTPAAKAEANAKINELTAAKDLLLQYLTTKQGRQ